MQSIPAARLSRRSAIHGLALVLILIGGALGQGTAPRPAAAGTAPATAQGLIAAYQGALLAAMQESARSGAAARAAALEPVLRATYDYARMARAAAGRAWREADDAARAAMTEAFARYSAAVHASRFNGYDGERFEIDGTEAGPADTTIVRTRILKRSGAAVPIGYVVADTPDGPRIVDVLLDGSVSEVAMRRSEWSAVAKARGLAGLAEALTDKTAEMLGPA